MWNYTDDGELDEDVASWRPAEIHSAPVNSLVVIADIIQ